MEISQPRFGPIYSRDIGKSNSRKLRTSSFVVTQILLVFIFECLYVTRAEVMRWVFNTLKYTLNTVKSWDREYLMYNRVPGISLSYDLAPPTPPRDSKLPLFLSLPVCCPSSLLTGGGGRSQIMRMVRKAGPL
jgi:hypothetical protein